jgi:hypothetical protein
MTRFHHVGHGTSATSTIVEAGIPGTWSIWADPLDEGPVPGGLSDAELLEVRRRFLGAGTVELLQDYPSVADGSRAASGALLQLADPGPLDLPGGVHPDA